MKMKIPIKEGLFRLTEDGNDGCLLGSKCRACGETFYPQRAACGRCFREELEEVPLEKRGTLHTYTIARTGMPGSVVNPPFISGIVELPNRMRIVSLITGFDLDKVEIGSDVELYFWKTGEDDRGNEVTAFAFRPVSSPGQG